MELDYKAIGKRIKIARIKADMKQEHLKVSLSAIVSLANALGVTADDLLCDSVVHARVQFEQDIAELLEDCDDYEIRMVKDMTEALIATLRRDAHLRQ